MDEPTDDKNHKNIPATAPKPNPIVNTTGWRGKVRVDNIKFDDVAKETYLEMLYKYGNKALAAKAANVCGQTVGNHLKRDPDFEASVEATLAERNASIVKKIEDEALAGYEHPIVNKMGEVIGHKRMVETPIRLAMLKRYDKEYVERKEIDVTQRGGVLVVPATKTPEQWVKDAKKLKEEMQEQGYIEHDPTVNDKPE